MEISVIRARISAYIESERSPNQFRNSLDIKAVINVVTCKEGKLINLKVDVFCA